MEIETVAKGYKVEGEIGRFQFDTHRVLDENGAVFNTSRDFFSGLKPKERYITAGFKEIAMFFGDIDTSYRDAAKLVNRVRHQEVGGTPHRTLHDNTEREGLQVIGCLEKKTGNVLKRHGFSEDGCYKGGPEALGSPDPVMLPHQTARAAARRIDCEYSAAELLDNPVSLEDPSYSAEIKIDDVSVKKQCEKRKGSGSSGERSGRKYVHDTVIRVDRDGKHYSLVGSGMKATIRYLIAVLLSNGLLGQHFVFFTDGHTILNDTIRRCFEWYSNWKIILDWYHLVKKCKECLSLSLKGRFIRNDVLRQIMPLLWHGFTDRAIEVLETIDSKKVKDNERLIKLIAYLKRNKDIIPCYALRKKLGLRNSSAIGEKMNDLIVSSRQKHNGMSWSKIGSIALAALTAIKLNRESHIWLENRKLNLRLTA